MDTSFSSPTQKQHTNALHAGPMVAHLVSVKARHRQKYKKTADTFSKQSGSSLSVAQTVRWEPPHQGATPVTRSRFPTSTPMVLQKSSVALLLSMASLNARWVAKKRGRWAWRTAKLFLNASNTTCMSLTTSGPEKGDNDQFSALCATWAAQAQPTCQSVISFNGASSPKGGPMPGV